MNVATKCLFGGAFIGAGLCSSATAGDVNWDFGIGRARDLINYSYDSHYGPNASWNADTGLGTYSHGCALGFGMAADARSSPNSYAYAYTYGMFKVDTDTTFLLSWDIEGGTFQVFGNSGFILDERHDESGTLEFTFVANEEYYIFADLFSFSTAPSTISMNAVNVLPCPADMTGDCKLNFFDISGFLVLFQLNDPIADFTGDGSFNFFDVSAFLSAFAEGCP